jgi:hypothetical protein
MVGNPTPSDEMRHGKEHLISGEGRSEAAFRKFLPVDHHVGLPSLMPRGSASSSRGKLDELGCDAEASLNPLSFEESHCCCCHRESFALATPFSNTEVPLVSL